MANLTEPVGRLFLDRIFHVPDYQRGYAWEKKQWDDLLQDLELLPRGRDHFTGTLVLCPNGHFVDPIRDEEGRLYTNVDIIDGQQRLTTIVLLLMAVQAEMGQISGLERLATGIRELYLAVRDRNQQWQTKLRLNRDSQDFYEDALLAGALGKPVAIDGTRIRSHDRLNGAAQHFLSYLATKREELAESYPDWLDEFYDKITRHLVMIVYTVDSETDAGVIFETMNDRGKPLTELEKVKNYLLYVASKLDLEAEHYLQKQINQTWTHILEHLMAAGLPGEEHEDQLLRAHWLMAYDPLTANWKQSRSIKERLSLKQFVGKHVDLLHQIQNYLSSLRDAATAYCDIHQPRQSKAFNNIPNGDRRNRIIRASEKVARLGPRATFFPLLMAVRLRATDQGETYLQVVNLCERYDFRVFNWLRLRANAGQPRFFRMAFDFYRNPNSEQLIARLAQTVLDYCSNERFAERFHREGENWYRWSGLKYFLYEYEEHLAEAAGKPIHYAWEKLWSRKRDTLEHILPQTPTDAYWTDRFDEKQRAHWTHNIGNMTLTYDNSALGNRPFPDKKGRSDISWTYASSKFFVEQQLTHYDDWSVASLEKRRGEIEKWAVQRWHVEPPISAVADASISVEMSAEKRFLRKAEEAGTLEGFEAILAAARRHPVYLRMQRNWDGVKFTPLQNRQEQLFWVSPNLWMGTIYPEVFQKYYSIPVHRVQEILNIPYGAKLDPAQVEEFIAQLDRLFEEIAQEHGGAAGQVEESIQPDRYGLRQQFWTELLAQAQSRTQLHAHISPSTDNWIGMTAGKRGLSYNYVILMGGARIELYIDTGDGDQNQAIFDQLAGHREEIEKSFGGSLSWDYEDERRSCRIACVLLDGGLANRDRWPQIQSAMIDAMIGLVNALAPQIEGLVTS